MSLSRRAALRTLGGSGLVLGASAVGLSQCDSMPGSAIAPWTGSMSQGGDIREWVLAHALLAPNPHNLQPWIADLREPNRITLAWDPARVLVETDPFGRQILIGFGAFLELLDQAARARGHRADIVLFPRGIAETKTPVTELTGSPIARIDLHPDGTIAKDPLFAAVFDRRSCKEAYALDRPLTAAHADSIRHAHEDSTISLTLARGGSMPERLRELTRDAMLLELRTPRTLKESIDLTRVGAEEIAANPDGIDLHGPLFWWLKRLGLMTREKAMQPGTIAFQGGIDYALGWADATPSFGWIATDGNSREGQIAAGRAYVRLNLQATRLGVAMHPVSQLLQEYPEMTDLQRKFYKTVGVPTGQTVQMLFRLGYADRPAPSPRHPLDSFIRT